MNTVQSRHTVSDVSRLRKVLNSSKLLVRVNPIYPGSKDEIHAVMDAGADILMLPYFKTVAEVSDFLRFVNGRARTMLLFETPESVACIDEILSLPGIDECFVGLNDLHLGYGMRFMFELLADGTVDTLCRKFRAAGKPYGFGGIARIGAGALPAQRIIGDHVRLGSSAVILSRSFCNTAQIIDPQEIRHTFQAEVPKIRDVEAAYANATSEALAQNHAAVQAAVQTILRGYAND
jgi:2-keto-3-deoxy-L-rhamnonate aldolase RhmA